MMNEPTLWPLLDAFKEKESVTASGPNGPTCCGPICKALT